MGQKEKVRYSIYDTLDLIREEVDYIAFFTDDSINHDTVFYHLSDGKRYEEELNDSLQALIK